MKHVLKGLLVAAVLTMAVGAMAACGDDDDGTADARVIDSRPGTIDASSETDGGEETPDGGEGTDGSTL